METAPKEYDIRFSARYYIEGVSGYLNKSGKHLFFNLFSTCPHALFFDKVEDLRLQGRITDAEEQEMKSKLMMGQSENYKLDTYMASLKMEMSSLMYGPRNGQHPTNIIGALNAQVVFCIDVTSATNKLLFNTTLIGNSQISVVMSHNSGNSAIKWAEVFGQYDNMRLLTLGQKVPAEKRHFLYALVRISQVLSVSVNGVNM